MIKVMTMKTNNWLHTCGYTIEEEIDLYNRQLLDIINDPLWYLDNLDYLTTYRLSWGTYTSKRPVLPKKIETFINDPTPIKKDELEK